MAEAKEVGLRAESHAGPPVLDTGQAAGKRLEAGINFLKMIASQSAGAAKSTDHLKPIERALSQMFHADAQTPLPVLNITLLESFTVERRAGAIGGILNKLGGLT
jgi:hypothetical protein